MVKNMCLDWKQYIENNKDTIKKNKMDLSIQFSDTQTLSLKNI